MPASKTPDALLQRVLRAPVAKLLSGGLKGLEKESLRVTPQGRMAQTPHSKALGAALTHPHITTDYSEALIELVTLPLTTPDATLGFLADIHSFVYQHLHEEMLWGTSMPCRLGTETEIPIANYGRSNIGMMKHVYRRGLGWRYGRTMQTISGVHFNYSFPLALWPVLQELQGDHRPLRAFMDDGYFAMLRNFQRLGWLVPFFFGASPAVCKSFFHGRDPGFAELDSHTWYRSQATSLRMSDIGYKNKNQAHIGVRYNGLDDYVATLTHAISTPEPEYQAIGVKVDGEYRQLNANILQIENEFYTFVRPKQPIQPSERATLALKKRGVMYAEVRALDVNAYDPVGTDAPTLRFIEALLVLCLLTGSPPVSADEQAAINRNQTDAACCGRDPQLELQRNGGPVRLRTWASEITDEMQAICEALDASDPTKPYSTSLQARREELADPERLPSARVLADMRRHHESFFEFALRLSTAHRDYFLQRRLPAEKQRQFELWARQSLEKQARIEAADRLSFDDYLKQYFAQT
ncbi:MAG: glutamate--cysteine ligase [Gammaproteobacteria bacterium]|nr:glutamate--cysteine ligase [Gammaproteobacteria bacterium]MBU6509283.1 glutamate--cysteine ligase [Gammaproteobacteria bacterium]MDE1983877.1 glutamate--cysteine ligase [Gammaproteobacteria bacterium]MDE2460960.1 glutamate--cysteine ligase [Gammaproteobacteria bacterium]